MGKKLSTDPVYKEFKDGRIVIPNNFCEAALLADEAEAVETTLWMVSNGRYRILSGDHAAHPDIETLRKRISGRMGPTSATDFDDDAVTVMSVRLVNASLGPGKERRLSIPDIIQDVLRIRKEKRVVVVLDGLFVEIWSVDTFESTFNVPTSALI